MELLATIAYYNPCKRLEIKKVYMLEFLLGISLIIIGFILTWWASQLVWIEIYPSPWGKKFIERLPLIFWSLGASIVIDSVRRVYSIPWVPIRKRFYAFIIFLIMASMLSLLNAEHFQWPDLDHWKHGFPFFWLTHQTSSIIGVVNSWTIEWPNLLTNLIFWLPIALLFTCLALTLIGHIRK